MSHLVHSDSICALGEGALWHPQTHTLYWFDVLKGTLYASVDQHQSSWSLGRMASAAGWVDDTVLLIASERDLFTFDTATGTETHVADLEADNPVTRSNDGRADP